MTDGSNRSIILEKIAHHAHQVGIVAQIFGGPSAGQHHAGVFFRLDVAKSDIRRQLVARRFNSNVPFRMRIVLDEMIDAFFRPGDHHLVALLAQAEERIHRIQNLRGVANNEKDFWHANPFQTTYYTGNGYWTLREANQCHPSSMPTCTSGRRISIIIRWPGDTSARTW